MNPDQSIEAFADFYGGVIAPPKPVRMGTPEAFVPGMAYQKLGNAQTNLRVSIRTGQHSFPEFEMVAFRKGDIGVYMLFAYSEHFPGELAFPDFPNILAGRMAANSTDPLPTLTPTPVKKSDTPPAPPPTPYRFSISENPQTDWLDPGPWYVSEGYKRVELEDIGISQDAWEEAGFQEDTLYIYKNADGPKIIIGYTLFFQTYEEIGIFDTNYDLQDALEKISTMFRADSFREYQTVFTRTPLGTRSMLVDIKDQTYEVEIMKRREENYGFVIFTLQPPYEKDSIPINTRPPLSTADVLWHNSYLLIDTDPFREEYPLKRAFEIIQEP